MKSGKSERIFFRFPLSPDGYLVLMVEMLVWHFKRLVLTFVNSQTRERCQIIAVFITWRCGYIGWLRQRWEERSS
jgi:hypothetical protein